MGIGAAAGGGLAATPGIGVPQLTGTTAARITGDATDHTSIAANGGDVTVRAIARESVVTIDAGVAIGGANGAGGSAAVIGVNTLTEAVIGGTAGETSSTNPVVVNAFGNVLVSATYHEDDRHARYSRGGVASASAGGAGGAGAFA